MTEQIKNYIVMIATGEYSDFCTTPYRVLKPFTFREAEVLFRGHCKKSNKPERLGPGRFEGWLASNGYIEDYPCHEVHIGSYGELRVQGDVADVLFEPNNTVE